MCMKMLLCIIIKVNGAIVVKRSVFFNKWILIQYVVTCVCVYIYGYVCIHIYTVSQKECHVRELGF